ncbi:multiple inositol polyphosphate phosphatase 1-like isoform X3 [Lycorma delicatula]|uniref:multiple inositol polyphosphate phosphatase 1-like isoform X3 n=1 Tax=Lycorma delicatula TaxID=130591 RepID=UPI003F513EC7
MFSRWITVILMITIIMLVSLSFELNKEEESGERRQKQNKIVYNYCYADDPDPYLYFSSKTPYKTVYNESKFEPPPADCEAKGIWLLVRHGVRYCLKNSLNDFEKLKAEQKQIVHNHEILKRGSLCSKDIENLRNWKGVHIPYEESDQLTPEGYAEIVHQARRYKERFPTLFEEEFSENIYQIYPDCKDDVLYYNDDDNKMKSKGLFKKGTHMKTVIINVSERLGYSKLLPFTTIDKMYNLCRYSKSWDTSDISPWCAAFSKDDLKVFEYMNDLAYYYNSGPGLTINRQFGCPLMQDMLNQFLNIVHNESSSHYLGKFYFGHSTTLFNLLSVLGTHTSSEHITVDNYDKMHNRIWQTSHLDPFGSNFAAVLLKCESDELYKIAFYLNEMNFEFKACGGNICSWNQFYDSYKYNLDPTQCNTDYCTELEDIMSWLLNTDIKIQNENNDEETNKNSMKLQINNDENNNDGHGDDNNNNAIKLDKNVISKNDTTGTRVFNDSLKENFNYNINNNNNKTSKPQTEDIFPIFSISENISNMSNLPDIKIYTSTKVKKSSSSWPQRNDPCLLLPYISIVIFSSIVLKYLIKHFCQRRNYKLLKL